MAICFHFQASGQSLRASLAFLNGGVYNSGPFVLHCVLVVDCYRWLFGSQVAAAIKLGQGHRADSRTEFEVLVTLLALFGVSAEHARAEINTWTKNETKGIIEEILPTGALDANSKCVLANALYFKGAWQNQFDASLTVEEDFYLPNGQTIRVPMMTTSQKQEITTHDSFKVLRLPYNKSGDGRSFSMYIVLPHERNGLSDVEKIVNADFLEKDLVTSTEVKVNSFKLPRFKVSGGYEMPDVLAKLGLTLPFSDKADFSKMVDSPIGQSLSIDKVYHKAAVEVNEEGTVAAAATAAVVMLRSIQPMEAFVADHPFLFVLKEDMTGMVVFIGHVTNPIS
ncbi:hypothetical protein L7F22_016589 [Adiantum nelumboides]|nr:hypothetical protein [Adiantum nelumboides]